jgi:hypothetical protein
MKYRLDYTLRVDGLERGSCHYCPDLETLNETLATLEEHKAWGFAVHETTTEEQEMDWLRLTRES